MDGPRTEWERRPVLGGCRGPQFVCGRQVIDPVRGLRVTSAAGREQVTAIDRFPGVKKKMQIVSRLSRLMTPTCLRCLC